MDLNEVRILGRLSRDVEVRFAASGKAVANFSVATEERFKGADGTEKKTTTWHNVTCWGALAERVGEVFAKGQLVFVADSLKNETFETKSGEKPPVTKINAHTAYPLLVSKGGKKA